ncbi:hypothetical protein L7F22_018899 [Adiantum nelumboides]|nr:hypothetical protein [Adiantum nelumboides]
MVTTNVIATVGCSIVWVSSTLIHAYSSYRQNRQGSIQLPSDDDEDDYGLSQASIQGQLGPEEIEAINHIQKQLDGSPVKVEQHKKYVRNSRLLISACAAFALALLGTQIGLQKPFKQSIQPIGWSGALHNPACWPLFADVFIWLNIFYFALQGMRGSTYWSAIVQLAVLSMTAVASCAYLLVVPEAISDDQIPYYGAQLVLAFIALGLSINVPSGPRHEKETPNGPRKMAMLSHKGRSLYSQLWFTGSFDVIWIAQRKGTIDEDDPPLLGSDFDAHLVHLDFKRQYNKYARKPNDLKPENKKKMFSVLRDAWPIAKAVFFANYRLFVVHHIMLTIAAFGWYIPSFVSYAVVKLLEDSEKGENGPASGSERLRFGFQYCLLLVSAILAQSLLIEQALTITLIWLRNRIRTQLQMAIFAKALRRKDVGGIEDFKVNDAAAAAGGGGSGGTEGSEAKENDEEEDNDTGSNSFSKAQVINLVSVDAERVSQVFFLFTLAMAPFEILTGGFFAIYLLGWSAVIGLATSFAFQPLLYFLGKAMTKAEDKHQEVRDRKTSLLNENSLTPSVGFTSLQILDELRFSLTYIPEAISQLIQTFVSLRRIQRYLESEEVEIPQRKKVAPFSHEEVTLTDASIGWPKIIQTSPEEEELNKPVFVLDDISVRFTPNSLNLIVGKLGSGKTLLLKGLLGEADLLKGQIKCPRSLPNSIDKNLKLSAETWMRADQVAYLPQSSFLVNATLRENILFGLPLLEERYQSTLDACGLRPDLKILNDADETEIGENGIGLRAVVRQKKEVGKDGIADDSAPGSSAETSLNTTPATTAPPSPSLNDKKDLPAEESPKKPKKLVEEEKRAKGAVLRSIYARYIKSSGGLPVVVIVSLSLIAYNVMTIIVTKWLQYWTEDVEKDAPNCCLSKFASLQASKVLFKHMLAAVLKAPLRFHDTVSRGRLLNRFSYDFKEMDSEVVDTFDRTADQAITIVITMTAIATGGGLPFIGFFILMVPLYVYVGTTISSCRSIKIDGVDIGQVNLQELRSRLQIVPQDPIIFSGPLRASLDVFDEYTDEEVIAALKKVRLIEEDETQVRLVDVEQGNENESNQVQTTKKRDFSNLNFMVAEGGSNLSNGEKQLLCLARAILRNCKLIIFDEATSSVDFDTDAIISQTIRQAFERSTIITIAHRLRTIIDYDFVAVMEKGNVVEFEKPSTLLRDSSSRFYKLCRASGKRELVHLKQSAGVE